MCLAQVHKAVTPMRLEPATPRSRVKHSITEPLRSINQSKNDLNVEAAHMTKVLFRALVKSV